MRISRGLAVVRTERRRRVREAEHVGSVSLPGDGVARDPTRLRMSASAKANSVKAD
jgi:hypothetical protein